MPLGTEVGLGAGDIVLDGDPAPPFPGRRRFWGRELAFSSLTLKILKLAYYRQCCIDSK